MGPSPNAIRLRVVPQGVDESGEIITSRTHDGKNGTADNRTVGVYC